MASNYHMQKPYVLATLPRSLAQPDSKAVVGEVCALRPGAKKRRRPEVAVGIDGEAANLYDIASSRLITSYPVPPQAKFSCPPCSLRLRSAAGKKTDVARYTYIATREPARRLSLFKDTVGDSGATSSATVTASLGSGAAVVFLGTVAGRSSSNSSDKSGQNTDAPAAAPDLLTVDKDGKVAVLDGETLQNRYQASVAALSQDLLPRGASIGVELAQTALATDVLKGLQLGEEYLSGFFARKVGDAGDNAFNPDMLLLVTAVTGGPDSGSSTARYLHVLAVDPEYAQAQQKTTGRLVQVHHMRLPAVEGAKAPHQYCLDVASGSLAAIEGEAVVAYDLAHGVPRISSQMAVPGVTSFLRLSKSSILAATPTSFSVYNPLYSSLQASADMADLPAGRSAGRACSLAAYFSQLDLAVALVDSHLVAVQLEPPRTRSKKRRADGLLIDSIGRGVASGPGHVSSTDLDKADRLLESGELADFDDFLAEKLGIANMADWQWQRPLDAADGAEAVNEAQAEAEALANGLTNGLTNGQTSGSLVQPSSAALTATPAARAVYPEADRHWVIYAIGRVLAVDQPRPGGRLRLRWVLPNSDIVNYLVDAGHLSVGNVRSALRASLQDDEGVYDADAFLGEALPVTLAHVDPSLDLLLRWLYATKLGATELLSAILLLMRSLELVAERQPVQPVQPDVKLLTNGDKMDVDEKASDEDNDVEDEADKDAGEADLPSQELDRLEQQLRVAEYFVEHTDNDPRNLALDMAIGKLGSCPASATVTGLRRLFRTDEIRSLIEVLRKQLVDHGWATRYLDPEESEAATATDGTPLNYSIRLIADLLGRCIDSVRPGEWLIHDETAAASDDPEAPAGDFFASLKWQVSAALEGVQEALYLRGILAEAVRYSHGVQASVAGANTETGGEAKVRPERVDAAATGGMLPLGLKAPTGKTWRQDVSLNKVVAGGEVLRRTRREMGHLVSKKVGAYTLERIVL